MTYPPDIDPECIPICDALNALDGITTCESCCGHGLKPFYVKFSVDRLENALPVAYQCLYIPGWSVRLHTDGAMSGPWLILEGPVGFDGLGVVVRGLQR